MYALFDFAAFSFTIPKLEFSLQFIRKRIVQRLAMESEHKRILIVNKGLQIIVREK